MRVADAVIEVLHKEGIKHLFCVPGATIDPFLECLASNDDVRAVVCAHEAGAAYMADGYGRASGRFGACLSIGGPGFTNTVTALATAFTDRSALFALSGEVRTDWEGRGSFQDSSAAGIRGTDVAASVTALQLHLSSSSQTYRHVERLFQSMLSHSSRGPVHLSIPVDIQGAQADGNWVPLPKALYQPRFVDETSCAAFWDQVGTKAKVAILAGSGCVQSDATQELIRFAERFDIPVATTLAAKGVFPEDHPLSLGMMGWFGNRPAIDAITSGDLDVLFVLGSRLNMLDTLVWSSDFKPRHALIANDINPGNMFRDYHVNLSILGDARSCLAMLNETSPGAAERLSGTAPARRDWVASLKRRRTLFDHPEHCESSLQPIHPARVMADLRRVMPRSTMLFSDSGAHAFFAGHYWTTYELRQFFSSIKYMGAMGWAIPAAIGAQFARPNDHCVVVTGDGCMLMHGIEIQTAARYKVPLICVVMNNSALGNPKLRADKVGPGMGRLHELPTHDWAGFARSLGARGITVNDPAELTGAFEQALAAKKAVVIDVRTGNYPTPTESFDTRSSVVL